ncbi:putative BING4 C-terminal domain-containing protein [Seiridium cardinale]|uniref:BING4 C-terminal domain-containing protein n=1 Tax=Seiridium cardinale TaxID=138064 RepID=A0ABR2Y4K1_9PEZI
MELDDTESTRRPSAKGRHNNGAVRTMDKARTELIPKIERDRIRRHKEARRDYGRGARIDVKGTKDKKLRRNLKGLESKYTNAAIAAKDAEILLEHESGFLEPENELERTYRVRQDEIQENVSINTAKKRFDLKLDQLGPYIFEYSRNGRDILLGGRKGHVSLMDWRAGKLKCELQLGESIRDVEFLADQFFAVSQKKYVYIYDTAGVEIHCMKKLMEVTHMTFLPYHYLLATAVSKSYRESSGVANIHREYQGISNGKSVANPQVVFRLGNLSLKYRPSLGLQRVWRRTRTMLYYMLDLIMECMNANKSAFKANSPEPLVKLLAHKGPVRSCAMDREGRYMVSTGQDCKMSVWDIRMFKQVNSYHTRTPASTVSISDRNLTAVGWSTNTTIWKDLFVKHKSDQEKVQSPYMSWGGEGKAVERVRWCPFEDTMGVSHDEGFSSIIVPGAGEANFDAMEVNPFETAKQRQESQVKGLLNKLQPEMIALDPNFVGNLDLRSDQQRQAEKDLDAKPVDLETEIKNKARGKNSALKKYLRKQRSKNVIDEKRMKIDQIWEEQKQRNQEKHQEKVAELGPALGRFARKE